jgi:dTDP-4-amino-4,6-dideoxygalactose transaminase
MKVPLLDLKAQYAALKNELDKALIKVAESQYFILGPEVEKLEESIAAYLGAKKAIGVSSGTDALLIALMALDIQQGDEVIVPDYSFFATAGVVSRLNAVPVFVDIDPVTFNIDFKKIEQKITAKTKAIIPVHLYGQSAEMDGLMEIAKKHKLKVVEDCAQAIGVQYKDGSYAGTIGDVGCFSFFPSKNLGGYGDGGIVVTNNQELGDKLKILRAHGAKPKYYHKIIGGNFRLDALQAAVLNVKLPHLQKWSEKRRTNAELYTKLFIEAGLSTEEGKIKFDKNNSVLLPKAVYKPLNGSQEQITNYHIYNQYIIRTGSRDELIKYLKEKEIGCEIYYPVPFHKQECFKHLYAKSKESFEHSVFSAGKSLALPIYPELTVEQISYIVETINNFFKKA